VAGMEGIKDGRMSVFEDGKLVLPPMAAEAGTPPAFAEPRTACAGMSPRNLLITAAHLRLAVEGSTVKQVTVAPSRRCPDTCVRRPLRATRGTGRGPLKRARRPNAPIKANLLTLVTDSGACYTLRTAPSGAESHNCAQLGASGQRRCPPFRAAPRRQHPHGFRAGGATAVGALRGRHWLDVNPGGLRFPTSAALPTREALPTAATARGVGCTYADATRRGGAL